MDYASKDIRNILVAGHAGCGKTTLTEALLYMSGATERMGRVEDGTTASDFDPEEVRRKASLNSSIVPVEYEGVKYNLIDVPGLFDFETGAAEGIMAAESVLICVSGRSGVTVGAEKAYQQIFPQAIIRAKVNRQVAAAPAIIDDLKSSNQLANTVLIGLGTNGPITDSMMAGIMGQLGDNRQVYWVNTHVPSKNWEASVNQELTTAAQQYPNLTIIDWHDYCEGQTNWFYDDNIHPNKLGRSNLVQLVAKTILAE